MANIKSIELQSDLFEEELSDADLMVVVGGTDSGVIQSGEAKVIGLQNKTLAFQYGLVTDTTDKLGTDGK